MGIGLKLEMHMKDDIRPLIPVAAETQVDLQNRSKDQVLARQNTLGQKKRCNILEIIVIGERALERGLWKVAVIY